MIEQELMDRAYSYAFYLLALAVFVSSLIFRSAGLVVLAAILLLAAAVYFGSGHIVNNFLLRRGRVIEIYNEYRLGENLASAVKGLGNSYLGVACAVLKGIENEENGETLTTLVRNTNFPFEFSLGMRGIDQARVLDKLEERRRFKEIEISRIDPDKHEKLNALRRELSLIESEIKTMRKQKMLSLVIKLKTFSKADDEYEAAREAYNNMEQLTNAFSSSLGLESEIVRGEKLLAEIAMEGGIG